MCKTYCQGVNSIQGKALVFCVLSFFFFNARALAAVNLNATMARYPAQKIKAEGVSDILIRGMVGRIRLEHRDTNYYELMVQHTKGADSKGWNMVVDRRAGQLVIEVFSVEPSLATLPKFNLKLVGPSRDLVLGWRKGLIELIDWQNNASVSSGLSDLRVEGFKGNLDVQIQSGNLALSNLNGRLTLRGGQTDVRILNSQGHVQLDVAEGEVSVQNTKGEGQVSIGNGKLMVVGASGQWQVLGDRTEMNIKNIAGSLIAKSRIGEIRLESKGLESLSINTIEAPVHLRLAGLWLDRSQVELVSRTGRIQAPENFQFTSQNGLRYRSHRSVLDPRGRALIRSESGPIQLKVTRQKP